MAKCNTKKHKTYNGVLLVAVSKKDGTKFYDIENRGGFITSYIRDVLGIEVPSLYFRKKYKEENGMEWWQQWFDIVEEEKKQVKKCPYCEWETYDVDNRTGAMEIHIKNTHQKTIEETIILFPEMSEYFSNTNKKIKKNNDFKDNKNYIICPICGKKFYKLTTTHLKNAHNLTFDDFRRIYPKFKSYSELMVKQIIGIQKISNLHISKKRFVSKYEKEISNFLTNNNIEHECNRQILIGRELDIFIPSKNIAIEFNGLRWHTEWSGGKDRYYHLDKTVKCNEKGIGLIHIFEDEYVASKDIVFSKLSHILNIKNENIINIHGRKCIIKEINRDDSKIFLNENHIQGFASSTLYLGAFYENNLVAVMSFKKETNNSDKWELTRFATKIGTHCRGIGGKLFSYFVKNYYPNEVKSFADRRWTVDINNNLYINLGFKIGDILKPEYRYYNNKIDKYKRIHKFSFRKQKLSKKYGFPLSMTETEMAKELGYDRIWDCGLVKYVWKNKKE